MFDWPLSSSVAYLTGGTSRIPRLVHYSSASWERSVRNKHSLFADYGIGTADRGAICTPFEPWSIGRIHMEAALRTGAKVLPLGLTLDQDATLRILADFNPTFICGGARYLARAGRRLREIVPSFGRPAYLFVAGEKLLSQLRSECAAVWDAKVVDIYGMAEFDMVGYEAPHKQGEFKLSSDLLYALRVESGHTSEMLRPGMTGELAIRSDATGAWHYTGDVVTVVHADDHASEIPSCISIVFDHRLETTIVLGEGTKIIEAQIVKLLDDAQLSYGQLRVYRTNQGDRLVLAIPAASTLSDADIIAALFDANVDLADSVRCKIADVTVSREAAESLFHTSRGKAPLIVEIADDPP
ncbi:hypothetical protein [Sinorhizobium meliloti]|uniref:hypothetical protein n=1 Tax=Rhizobium meliloti TaxID=382 RepID=UPI0013E2A9D0|nr:hypothetical protein [Sinorhizobium meliloti]